MNNFFIVNLLLYLYTSKQLCYEFKRNNFCDHCITFIQKRTIMGSLENIIRGKIMAIKNAKTKADGIKMIQEANLTSKLELLKKSDEAASDTLKTLYMNTVKQNSQKQ